MTQSGTDHDMNPPTDNGEQTNSSREKSRKNNANITNDIVDLTESLLDIFMAAVFQIWSHIKTVSSFLMVELGGFEAFDKIAVWCMRNPHIAICFLAAGIVFLLPFLIIFGFGIATMVMTFTGILVLEGTLLTFISMLFVGCLCGFIIVVVVVAVVAVAAYIGFERVYDFHGGMERHRQTLLNFVQGQRSNNTKSAEKSARGDGKNCVNNEQNDANADYENIENIIQ